MSIHQANLTRIVAVGERFPHDFTLGAARQA